MDFFGFEHCGRSETPQGRVESSLGEMFLLYFGAGPAYLLLKQPKQLAQAFYAFAIA